MLRTPARLFFATLFVACLSLSGCDLAEELTTVRIPITITQPQTLPIVAPGGCPPTAEDTCVIYVPEEDGFYVNFNLADMNSQLANAADRIQSVEVEAVTVNIRNNTLERTIQPIELRIGAPDADFGSALALANTPEIEGGFEGDAAATVVEENSAGIAEQIGTLAFGIGMRTALVAEPGEGGVSGSASAAFSLDLIVTIQAIK